MSLIDHSSLSRSSSSHLDSRLARLSHLINLNAPRIIIISECGLVLRAYFSNSYLRLGIAAILEAIQLQIDNRLVIPVNRLFCRLNIYHHRDDEGHCYTCERDKEGKTYREILDGGIEEDL